MSKKINIIIGGILIIIVAVILITQSQKGTGTPPVSTGETTNTTPVTTGAGQTTGSGTTGGTTTGAVTTPTTYTLADVAKHGTQSDCWTTVNGSVYNVTSWISQHPGGAEAIISLCGIDGSDAFNGQHGGERRPVNELASFKIGTLAQ